MNAESTRNLDEILSTEQLEGFQSRAARYDANNEFFQEDFDEMKASGQPSYIEEVTEGPSAPIPGLSGEPTVSSDGEEDPF